MVAQEEQGNAPFGRFLLNNFFLTFFTKLQEMEESMAFMVIEECLETKAIIAP